MEESGQKEHPVENPKIQFVFKGFSQVAGIRVFAFEGVAADATRATFTVKTDLALSRTFGIRLQELPLLCRAVLERDCTGVEKRNFAYTEEDMGRYADFASSVQEAALKRKAARRSANNQTDGIEPLA